MISVGSFGNRSEPVESSRFSTAGTHGEIALTAPFDTVFPVVHTPYYAYKKI